MEPPEWLENQNNSHNFSLISRYRTFAAWLTSFVYLDEITPPPLRLSTASAVPLWAYLFGKNTILENVIQFSKK